MGPSLRPREIEGRKSSTSQFSEPGDLSRSRQHDDLNRFCLSGALELRGRNGRLEKNHCVRWTAELCLRYANVRVVIVIAEGAESLPRSLGGRRVTRYYYGGGRIQVIEQASERGGSGARADGDVPDDGKLVILRHLWDFDFRRTYLPRPAGIPLDEILDDRSDLAHHDDSTRVSELAKQRLQSRNRFWPFLENVIRPGKDDRLYGINLEKRSADEPAELCRATGNREHWAGVENPGGTGRTRDGNDLDSSRARYAQHGLRDSQGRFRIASDDHDLRASRRGIHARQDRSQKFRNRLGRMRKGVNQILVTPGLSGRALSDFLRFQHPQPLICNVAQCLPRRYRYMSHLSRRRRSPKIAASGFP